MNLLFSSFVVVVTTLSLLLSSDIITTVDAAIDWNVTFQSLVIRFNTDTKTYQTFNISDNSTEATNFGPTLAFMDINRTYNLTGWDILDVSADQDYLFNQNATQTYYAAGILEAVYTWDTIWDSWVNWGVPVQTQVDANPYNGDWIDKHIAYLRTFNGEDTSQPDYKRQAAKLMAWLDGVVDGYNLARNEMIANGVPLADDSGPLTHRQIFLMSFQDEVGDVNQSNPEYSVAKGIHPNCPPPPEEYNEHCSSLTKLTDDDVIITHATWSHFRTMLRHYKTYNFENSVTLSGYPGMLVSDDDWYITSNKLVVTETTNNQFNTTLSNEYVKPKVISEFLRVMVACFLAKDNMEWMDLFLTENSGTYPNQWITLDMKKITPAAIKSGKLPANTLWVMENVPGPYSEKQDMTWFLNKYKYWPSFNRPYFKSVADISCNTYYHETWGPLWGYYDYCRYEIFQRDQHKVTDIDSMKTMIRYNDWKNDPFSKVPWCNTCNPANGPSLSVAARYDLISPTYADGTNASQATRNYLKPIYDGAIDAKITSFKSFEHGTYTIAATKGNDNTAAGKKRQGFKVKSYIIDGPTNDMQPTFSWLNGTISPVDSHRGQPDVFNFPWIEVETVLQIAINTNDNKGTPTWTVVIVTGSVVAAIVIFVVVYKTFFANENPPSYEEIQADKKESDNSNNDNADGGNFSPKEHEERNAEPLIK